MTQKESRIYYRGGSRKKLIFVEFHLWMIYTLIFVQHIRRPLVILKLGYFFWTSFNIRAETVSNSFFMAKQADGFYLIEVKRLSRVKKNG